MLRNKGILFSGLVVSLALVFGGCSLVAKQADVNTETPTVTITGVITSKEGGYMITENGKNTELDGRKVDLKSQIGKTVTVEGEFSGTTLFVDSVK